MIKRRILDYLVLVGLPFLGIAGVLHLGEKATSPPAVAGLWQLEADLKANAGTPCANRLSHFQKPDMLIAQSGVFLEISLHNERTDHLIGRLEGTSFSAEAKPSLFGGDIFDLLRISGSLSDVEGQKVLRGWISMPRQIECVPVPFLARLSGSSASRRP